MFRVFDDDLFFKKKIYMTVIDEVITNVRETFLDEGYDEQLLQELKHVIFRCLSNGR